MAQMVHCRNLKRRPKIRVFRLNSGRFYVRRLLRLLRRIRCACSLALGFLKKEKDSRDLSVKQRLFSSSDCRPRSFGRSNSFYAEAIADCLEFIKRSSSPESDVSGCLETPEKPLRL
ncbi:hypothetical protein AMTR_s00022p00137840 [Amborella trichopoda]|uniref:Josephin-like protein n=1 Tax=Amborella trichopoda TaxID=13333 RepID=W1PUZ5_AMBTC|nr:hypothetical protein AMTR_s00022p00137840 [Amborella trichopoda]